MDGKKTRLYEEHKNLGAKIVNYAGWEMPVQYEGLVQEHNAVRNEAGLFDVSHMGNISVKGKDALPFLDYVMTNDISKLNEHQIVYTFMCYPEGGVVEDLLVYKTNDEEFNLIVNAANIDKDWDWINEQKKDFDVELENLSPETAIIAIQGPKAQEILQKLTETKLDDVKFFYFKDDVEIDGVKTKMISRTGYTGENGFEIYLTNDDVVKVWNSLLEAGKEEGLKPTGLGCRDTLRFEAMLPLYGQELSKDISPLEAGLKFFVKLNKESDFIGKKALQAQADGGLERTLVGFELLGRGIPREGYEVYKNGEKIGHVTTGYMSPTLNKNIGNALIKISEKELGNEIDIMIRKKPVKAKIISKNFLKNK
ncbi:glycine cleavage system aminomethyltransferase GcvT [Tissierella creatinophila]|uniref:Aminomethyltransferase n=1 Tax=Tissierella creatinophila DSM 6911 TaxID=1123403 RepID=A0A1U7M464_TISCR|nr:glycine cleavage system aminomethyltransferase GcvT [Tissierella creatinophila]OLS02107.1 aminomethyltransferase [Tissierella creatinophila DSM 6911]